MKKTATKVSSTLTRNTVVVPSWAAQSVISSYRAMLAKGGQRA